MVLLVKAVIIIALIISGCGTCQPAPATETLEARLTITTAPTPSPLLPTSTPSPLPPTPTSTGPRTEVITYTIRLGDTILSIAEMFGLRPETILWGNYYTLADNPDRLTPGQEIYILPADGVYHHWSEGENLESVARNYGVAPEAIINWPGNHLDPAALGDWSDPNIEPGTMLFVPGGQREFVTWSAPRITRDYPEAGRLMGSGACAGPMDGAVGSGSFAWPADNHTLAGNDYLPYHLGIDIAGELGDPVYAADDGVVVYSGWNDWGYGYVVVIDHGNGWQTLYAHLGTINAGCGMSVYQGNVIGAIGSTGNASTPNLHFEMMYQGGYINPWNVLP